MVDLTVLVWGYLFPIIFGAVFAYDLAQAIVKTIVNKYRKQ